MVPPHPSHFGRFIQDHELAWVFYWFHFTAFIQPLIVKIILLIASFLIPASNSYYYEQIDYITLGKGLRVGSEGGLVIS